MPEAENPWRIYLHRNKMGVLKPTILTEPANTPWVKFKVRCFRWSAIAAS